MTSVLLLDAAQLLTEQLLFFFSIFLASVQLVPQADQFTRVPFGIFCKVSEGMLDGFVWDLHWTNVQNISVYVVLLESLLLELGEISFESFQIGTGILVLLLNIVPFLKHLSVFLSEWGGPFFNIEDLLILIKTLLL